MIKLKQVNGGVVTSLDDALLYSELYTGSGIISGCTVTLTGNNQLNIADGRGVACGRFFTISGDESVLAQLSTSGTMQGRVLVRIDLSNIQSPISIVTQVAETLPDLVQEDLNAGGDVYEIPLATYQVTETAVSGLTSAQQSAVWRIYTDQEIEMQDGTPLIQTGMWTPTLCAGEEEIPSLSYVRNIGRWTRVGSLVYVIFQLQIQGTDLSSYADNTVRIGGISSLPDFPSIGNYGGVVLTTGYTGPIITYVQSGWTTMQMYKQGFNSLYFSDWSSLTDTSRNRYLYGSFVYSIDPA